MTITNQ